MKRLLILLILALLSLEAGAQKVTIDGVVRDTSFSTRGTYRQQVRRFPFVAVAEPILSQGVKAIEGLVYSKPSRKRELHLNIYRPDDDKSYPALLMIHGGGWNSGDMTMEIPMAMRIAAQGFVTIPVEYRLIAEGALFPTGVHDVKAAVRWVRANAATYGIDPDRIAIEGESAGGQVANLVGATNGNLWYEGTGGTPGVSSSVQAVIDVDGVSDFSAEMRLQPNSNPDRVHPWLGASYNDRPEVWRAASPLYQVSALSAPVCFITSPIARFAGGWEDMVEKLAAHDIYSERHAMPDTLHPFWLLHPWMMTTTNYMVNFLNRVFPPSGAETWVRPDSVDFVVALDGSGDFTSVQAAIDAVPDYRKVPTRIFIRNGFYREKLVVAGSKTNVTLIGEDNHKTVLTYDDYARKRNRFGEEVGTGGSASTYIYGEGFTAHNLCFEAVAGPVGQALAVSVQADRAAFYGCRFLGYQDTIYAAGPGMRQYFERCYIEGTTDFIFGSATAWFEQCDIYCKRNSFITAANTPQDQPYGYILNRCRITIMPGVDDVKLGRPWRPWSMVVFQNCELPAGINPVGWNNWGNPQNEATARYFEYGNTGLGADRSGRVAWSRTLDQPLTLEEVMRPNAQWNPLKVR